MCLCGATMGLVYANSLGQIAQSRNVPEAVLLSISSSFGLFGRFLSAPLLLFTRLVAESERRFKGERNTDKNGNLL